MTSNNRPRRLRSLVAATIAGVGTLAVLSTACNSEDAEPDTLGEPIEVTITENGVTPEGVRLLAPDRYALTVHNESARACDFSFGGLVSGLEVDAGDRATVSFETLDSDANDAVEIGCGDDRTGQASVRQPGS